MMSKRHRRAWGAALAALACLALGSGCATETSAQWREAHGPFLDPAERIGELLDAGDLEGASATYAWQRDWFRAGHGAAAHARLVTALGAELDAPTAGAERAIAETRWPVAIERWGAVRASVTSAGDALAAIEAHDALADDAAWSDRTAALRRSTDALRSRVRPEAGPAFASWSLLDDASFFARFPLDLSRGPFLLANRAAWASALDAAGIAELDHLGRTYAADLPEPLADELAERIIARRSATEGTLQALRAVERVGLPPPSSVRVIDVSPPARGAGGGFSVGLVSPGTLPLTRGSLEHLAARPTSEEVLIVVDAVGASRRVVTPIDDVESEREIGVELRVNARAAVLRYELAKVDAWERGRHSGSGGAGLHSPRRIEPHRAWALRRPLLAELRSAPSTVAVSSYEPYTYRRASVVTDRLLEVTVHVLDRRRGTIERAKVRSVLGTRRDEVALGFSPLDRFGAARLGETIPESELRGLEQTPATIDLGEVLAGASVITRVPGATTADLVRAIRAAR